LQEILS